MTRPVINKLLDDNNNEILDLNGNWTSKAYELNNLKLLGIQLNWVDPSVEGSIFLEYSCDTSIKNEPAAWTVKTEVPLDGTFGELTILDSDIPVNSYRIRFVHSSGTSALTARIATKM